MSIIAFFILNLLIFALVKYLFSKKWAARHPNLPPGPPRVPIIGSIPFLPKEFRVKGRGLHTPKLFKYLAEKYGPVFHLWLGPIPTIVICDPKILREAFKHWSISSRPIMRPFHEFRYGSKAMALKIVAT